MTDQTGEHETNVADLVPETWDLFDPDWDRMQRSHEEGRDVRFAYVRIYKINDERATKDRIAGEFAADLVSTEWLEQSYGPGHYEIQVLNEAKAYIIGRRRRIGGERNVLDAGPAHGQQLPQAPALSPSIVDKLLVTMIERSMQPPAQDPLRESIARITELMATSMQHSQQVMTAMAQMQSQNNNGGDFKELIKEMLAMQRQQPTAPGGGASSTRELMQVMGMGMQLANEMRGGGEPKWHEILPQLAETLGGPIAAIFASGIKDDAQREQALRAINHHQTDHQQPPIDDSAPIDTSGEDLL